jgi:hypothetical protein
MNLDQLTLLYVAFLKSRFIKCEGDGSYYDITYVEGDYLTELYLVFKDGEVQVAVSQQSPRYPVYDSAGNVIYFGV